MAESQGSLFGGEGQGRKRRPVTEDEKTAMCLAYEKSGSCVQVGRAFDRPASTVCYVLRERGVRVRGFAEWHRGRYPLREGAFDNAENDPVAAYWIGMLMADGSVASRGDGTFNVALALTEEDRGHVEAFRAFLGATGHTITTDRSGVKNGSQPSARFAVCSDRLVTALARYGVIHDKTYRTCAVGLEASPDFWRGCVDGDGCLGLHSNTYSRTPVLQISGSRVLMGQFSEFVRSVISGVLANVIRTPPLWRVKVTGKKGLLLIAALYSRAGPALARKAEIARRLLGSA